MVTQVIDFHEQKEVNGIKFWCYVAGHVLGACMFMVEIAGVRTLYTGLTFFLHLAPLNFLVLSVQATFLVSRIATCVPPSCPPSPRMS